MSSGRFVRISSQDGFLVARFGDGRELHHRDAVSLADLLLAEGVDADDVSMPDWRDGDIAPGVGRRIAIFGRMRTACL